MVLGIFEEGHPKLDLNDPYYCYIGRDPEKGVNLYADLRNNCQRGYKQFGERLMHVDQDLFDDVKARLARSMGIDRMKVKEIDPDMVKLLKGKIEKLEESNKRGTESVKKLLARIDGNKLEMDEARTLLNERNSQIEKLQEANDRQTDIIKDHLAAARKDAETIKELKERNADLEKMVNELDDQLEKYEPATPAAPQQAVTFDNDLFTGMVIDSKVKETKIQMLEDQVKMLRQMVFNMIKGGGAA
jgi:chromosome segregation ATPase